MKVLVKKFVSLIFCQKWRLKKKKKKLDFGKINALATLLDG